MAFNLGASNPSAAELGAELPDVYAEEVGFKGVSGDSNVQFLSTPWPAEALPAPTCSLLAVAATKGVVVGAGPNSLSVASSESVRAAICTTTGESKISTKPFQPQATIPLPARPTHIAFASGDCALILLTENAAQLSVFETTSLLQPNPQPALTIPTNGATFRVVAPNPAQPDDSHSAYVALVTTKGELLIADLKAGSLLAGPNGNILKTGVSSVSWSNKGKQLVAGLEDGTGYQMTPDGAQKALIPRPPDVTEPCHVSSVSWLENDIILMVYTPNVVEDEMGQTPSSYYYIITRRKQAPFLFQRLPEVASPFGMKRAPAYQFIARLRDYKPYLKDVLIVSSTASSDVSLITRSDQPLANEESAKATVGLFVTTEFSDDAKKASVPLKDSTDETSVIGLGIDLTSSELVVAPIQGEDIAESSTPLPNLLLLNHEGMLCSWWFIYNEAIRQKIPYSVAVTQQQPSASQPQALQQPQAPKAPAFGQSSFGSSSSLGATNLGASAFGKPLGAPAFGSPSAMGSRPTPTFGASGFGSPSQIGGGPSFGSPSTLGQSGPQFGKTGFGSTSVFGQPSTPKLSFGTPSATTGGGFGSFASSGGFGSLAASNTPGESPFAKTTQPSPFGAQPNTASAFGTQITNQSSGLFGLSEGGFKLESTFKGDGTAVNDGPKPEKPSGLFSLGGSLDDMVSTPTKPSPPTESMDDMDETPIPRQDTLEEKKPAPSLFGAPFKTNAPPTSSLFGSQPQSSKSPFAMLSNATPEKPRLSPSSSPSEKTAIASPPLTQAKLTDKEPKSLFSLPEPPLPPDSTSKAAYGPGDTSASSNVSKSSVDDAPLPPDFITQPKPVSPEPQGEPPLPPGFTEERKKAETEMAEDAPLPPDFTIPKPSTSPAKEPIPLPDGSDADESEKDLHTDDESEFADSGEDVTHEVGPPEASAPSLKTSPESSFGVEASPSGGLFERFKARPQPPSRPLFGEIDKPIFPVAPLNSVTPRSPSPVRPSRTNKGLPKLDSYRSISAPHRPGSALAARKVSLSEAAKREALLRPGPAPIRREERPQSTVSQEEDFSLSDDDEDERLRADLARPLEPVPTLDPFLPHQDYTGETTKPGIPGQIERLYRDINSMVDTLGINVRSLASYLAYQKSSTNPDWIKILQSDQPSDILDEKLLLREIEELDHALTILADSLDQQRVQRVEEKLESCRELLGKDILSLRTQCASVRKTLDAYTDTGAILSAPLSAEQANLQQDLRSSSAEIQTKLADLESAVSLLRARIADAPRSDGSRKRPTVEAVTSTIATMMNMAESKSSDIDVLEVQLKKLGIDTSAPVASREGSPFTTPRRSMGRQPTTPGSQGSTDGPRSAYHTPDSAARGINFRSSISGSAKASRLRTVESVGSISSKQETTQWKAKTLRKHRIAASLKKAIEEKKSKIRSVDDM